MIELALILALTALAVGGFLFVRIGRRVSSRRGAPPGAETSFVRSLMEKPPPKPPAKYTLSRRPPPSARDPGRDPPRTDG